jgi:S1-C subfamily serine protease
MDQAHQSPRRSTLWLLLALLALLAAMLWRFWPQGATGVDADAEPRAVTPRGNLAEEEKTTIAIFRQASPSVVHITTLAQRRDFFSLDVLQIPQGTGTGILWDQEGHVVTNFHVIRGADAAQVTLANHSTWKAKLVGAYPDKDLAVLYVEAPKDQLRPIPIGSSADLQVGQKVFAIGNPFGLDQSLTTGVISALGREIESVTRRPIKDVIQTDAAINPGNSGGPLLDSAGRLIGLNAAIFSPSGTFAGVGFAIPVDEVNRLVPQLIRHGKVIRPGLGVQVAPDQLARDLGVNGVLILGIQPDSPAAKAGLRATRRGATGLIEVGDAIVAVDDHPVRSVKDLFAGLAQHGVGEKVGLTVLRDGKQQRLEITLASIE